MKLYKAFYLFSDGTLESRHSSTIFKVGESYKVSGALAIGLWGYHACPNPFDCFRYYPYGVIAITEIEVDEDMGILFEGDQACFSFFTITRIMKEEEYGTGSYTDFGGNKFWYSEGERHREGGPAIEWATGTKEWFQHGKHHREDGPAVITHRGNRAWFRDGRHHREDGPAVITHNGDKKWYQEGVLHRTGGPAIEYADGSEVWYMGGEIHRCGGYPAVIRASGEMIWYWKGKIDRNRRWGPAIVGPNRALKFYENGEKVDAPLKAPLHYEYPFYPKEAFKEDQERIKLRMKM